MQFLRVLPLFALLPPAFAASWSVSRSPHFEVFTDSSPETARTFTNSLERLRAFFVAQVGIIPPGTVRVICFATEAEFAAYRTRSGSAGFSLHTPDRDYIVLRGSDLRVSAHEYSHLVIHTSGWSVPEWLAEGISEVAATVRVGERFTLMGGDMPGRSSLLKSGRWLSPEDLFQATLRGAVDPVREPLFYAQSWALAEMLMVAPRYAAGIPALLAMFGRGSSSRAALEGVYHTSIDAIFHDLRERQARGPESVPLPGIAFSPEPVHTAALSTFAARNILADLRHAAGELAQADADYRALALEQPASAEIHAALGVIAVERRDPARAVEEWSRSLALGIEDPMLCYRFAQLADNQGVAPASVRAALERAIALRPRFDDALFRLAMMDKNEGRPEAAVDHLLRMQKPGPDHAWVYYTTLADALIDLGRRDEARQAAADAQRHAASDAERARAAQLLWLANSVITVEIAADAQGQKHFRAVRVPVQAPARNPFFEAEDDARAVDGMLEEVKCSMEQLMVVVSTAGGRLTLAVSDPSRVQIRNAGGVKFEFVCGPQKPRPVLVEYAAPSTLRGLEFRQVPLY